MDNNISQTILEVYKKCGIKNFPFNCADAVKKYGCTLFTYADLKEKNADLFNLCVSYSNDSFVLADRKMIFYNSTMSPARIRFSIMHELGHIVYEHGIKNPVDEDEADRFATYMLAPMIIVHRECLKRCTYRMRSDDIKNTFHISSAASNRIVMEYDRWYNNIAHTTRKPSKSELLLKEYFELNN